jgi:hypothetical protein
MDVHIRIRFRRDLIIRINYFIGIARKPPEVDTSASLDDRMSLFISIMDLYRILAYIFGAVEV